MYGRRSRHMITHRYRPELVYLALENKLAKPRYSIHTTPVSMIEPNFSFINRRIFISMVTPALRTYCREVLLQVGDFGDFQVATIVSFIIPTRRRSLLLLSSLAEKYIE